MQLLHKPSDTPRLRITDKKILEQRLDALADTVCPNDPRRRGELRAAALAALGAVGPALERLTCECGNTDCAGSGKDPRAGAITIYALTDLVPAAGEGSPRQGMPGGAGTPDAEPAPAESGEEPAEPAAPEHEPQTPAAESEPVGPSEPAEPAAHNEPIAPAARTEPAASTKPAETAA